MKFVMFYLNWFKSRALLILFMLNFITFLLFTYFSIYSYMHLLILNYEDNHKYWKLFIFYLRYFMVGLK